jgi:hypothetical protein
MSSSNDESSDEEQQVSIRQRVFLPRAIVSDPAMFRQRFRLTSRQADVLLGILGPELEPSTNRSLSLSAKEKLLCALRFYASNSFLYCVGDAEGNFYLGSALFTV